MLGFLLAETARPKEAIRWFETALALSPADPQALLGLAVVLYAVGDVVKMRLACESLVKIMPDSAEAWYHLALSKLDCEMDSDLLNDVCRALEFRPNYPLALALKQNVCERLGRWQEAFDAAQKRCEASTGDVEAWIDLGRILQIRGRPDEALVVLEAALAIDPHSSKALFNKAMVLQSLSRPLEALIVAEKARCLKPTDRDLILIMANLHLDARHMVEARDLYAHLAAQGPAQVLPARGAEPVARVAILLCPFIGNTPYEDLVKDTRYESRAFFMIPGIGEDLSGQMGECDVIFNLISDADLGSDIISQSKLLLDRMKLPIINDPNRLFQTDRASISQRFAEYVGLIAPKTLRLEIGRKVEETGLTYPIIGRTIGTHGGEQMQLLINDTEFDIFRQSVEGDCYITQYVDYVSSDGYFRKYRFIFIGDETYPYHLAIGDSWKVHHVTTRMAEHAWMRAEEHAFLKCPENVFPNKAMATLTAIRREIGLEYFGIDCALNSYGDVILFEVNATMLVHVHNEGFEYKNPYVGKIKDAFERLIISKAAINSLRPRRHDKQQR